MEKVYSIPEIKRRLITDQRWLERAIVVLYQRQTSDEQNDQMTNVTNNKGFTAFDAKRLSWYAEWINSGKHLSGEHLQRAKSMVPKYARQIQEEIVKRQKRKPWPQIS